MEGGGKWWLGVECDGEGGGSGWRWLGVECDGEGGGSGWRWLGVECDGEGGGSGWRWFWGCNTVGSYVGANVLEGQVLLPGPARDFSSIINFKCRTYPTRDLVLLLFKLRLKLVV